MMPSLEQSGSYWQGRATLIILSLMLAAIDIVLWWSTERADLQNVGDWLWLPLYLIAAIWLALNRRVMVGSYGNPSGPLYLPGWALRGIGWLMLLLPILCAISDRLEGGALHR